MQRSGLALLLLLLHLAAALALPWDDLAARCSSPPSPGDSKCTAARQAFQECDALFGGGSGGDAALHRACRVAAWAEGENHSLQRVGTGVVSARWSSTPMGSFWFASASRADDFGLSATFEETLCVYCLSCSAKM